ncbi:hypothetical protein Zmor_019603 [Zophobas morio]|uniref:Uncharacterized protein n=1 Tax=Zophobas morio TaxID=2755281 RepID=A0AA38I534_9CUCU|nr:hypothetical protein Zmor_019603 [Zophobas morio]
MVKGRRVRAVVACARSDDCCSPNPKRRGPKIVLPAKPHTLDAFFQDKPHEFSKQADSGQEILFTLMAKDESK